jgi:hypothetical protein
MNIPIPKARFKKIAIAFLLLSIAQWSYGGFILCYGADGHIAVEPPAGKDCCKTNESIVLPTLITQSDFDHCVDIPIGAQEYIASNRHTAQEHNQGIPLSIVSPYFFFVDQPSRLLHGRKVAPPHNPLISSLKTVILLI